MCLPGGKFLATSPSAYLPSPTPGLDARENFVEFLRETKVVRSVASSRGVPSDSRDAIPPSRFRTRRDSDWSFAGNHGRAPAIIATATSWCARMKSLAAVGPHLRGGALTRLVRTHLIH